MRLAPPQLAKQSGNTVPVGWIASWSPLMPGSLSNSSPLQVSDELVVHEAL